MSDTSAFRDTEVLRSLAERIDQHDSRAFNNLGVLYYSKGMHTEAVDALLRALTLDPRMQTAARNLEIAARVDGACDVRLAALAARIATDPDDRVASREQARLLRLLGRHVEATQRLDALIAEYPDDAEALLERGLLEQRAGELRRAQRWFERACAADATEPTSRLHLAEVLYQRGQNEQSLDALDALLLLDDELTDAHLLRGFVLGDMGRHEAGMQAARRAAVLNPAFGAAQPNLSLERLTALPASTASRTDSAPMMTVAAGGELAKYGLGLAFRQRGYFGEARREFERALSAGEDVRLVRHALGELDLVCGDFNGATKIYEELLESHGENARWRNELGVALHQRSSIDRAAENYRLALRSDPRYALAYNNLGVALAELGDAEAAREAFQQATAISPTFVRSRLNLARWLKQHGDPLGALALLRELASFHGRVAEIWRDLGALLASLGRTDDARKALVSAIEYRPNNSESHYQLAAVLQSMGDDAGAQQELQLATALSLTRVSTRLSIGIELQDECPEAAGAIDLLALRDEARFEEAGSEATVPARLRDADACASQARQTDALVLYQQVRKEHSANPARYVWRRAAIGEARSLCLLGRGIEALELLEQLLNESKTGGNDDAEVLALIAAAQAAAGKTNEIAQRLARAAIQRFLRLEPRSAALLHFVGDVALAINDDALGMILFRRALAVDPSRPSPRVAIARMLRRRNDMLAARLELVAALSAAPTLREALLELARLHCDAGRATDALAILISYLNRAPADAEALALLASALLQEGRDADARLALDRALRHDPLNSDGLELQVTLQMRLRSGSHAALEAA